MRKSYLLRRAVPIAAVLPLLASTVSAHAETPQAEYPFTQTTSLESASGEHQFTATITSPGKNQSIVTLEGAQFNIDGSDIVAVSDGGEVIENLSEQIESVPGSDIEYLSSDKVLVTINPEEFPQLELKCGISALSGGVGATVATGVALAGLGLATGGAGLAALALAGAAGYGTGAVAGGCFG